MKQNDKLLKYIAQLEVEEFIGLAKVLKVQLVEELDSNAEEPSERYAARDFAEVLKDIMEKTACETSEAAI